MIAHVSVPSRKPRETALLLAALMDGEAFRFPVVTDAWIAVARDGSGLAVEVFPENMAHHPGTGDADPGYQPTGPRTMPWEDQIFADGDQVRYSAFHFALCSPLDERRVLELARGAGLRALKCDRAGVFGVIEIWLENTLLVEVLCGQDVERYRAFMNPAGCAAMFGPGQTLA